MANRIESKLVDVINQDSGQANHLQDSLFLNEHAIVSVIPVQALGALSPSNMSV